MIFTYNIAECWKDAAVGRLQEMHPSSCSTCILLAGVAGATMTTAKPTHHMRRGKHQVGSVVPSLPSDMKARNKRRLNEDGNDPDLRNAGNQSCCGLADDVDG